MELFELIATTDVRDACDIFAGVYEQTQRRRWLRLDRGLARRGERRARDDRGGERLWATVDRPNVMIKVPGTDGRREGGPAAHRDGINVNITLLFAIDAYKRGDRGVHGGPRGSRRGGQADRRDPSVASFFVSRVDTEIDKRLDAAAKTSAGRERALNALQGKGGDRQRASSRTSLFQNEIAAPRWKALAAQGRAVQRPLWASTSTKNPAYRDVMYVEELIGPDTVNTMPPADDRGVPRSRRS